MRTFDGNVSLSLDECNAAWYKGELAASEGSLRARRRSNSVEGRKHKRAEQIDLQSSKQAEENERRE